MAEWHKVPLCHTQVTSGYSSPEERKTMPLIINENNAQLVDNSGKNAKNMVQYTPKFFNASILTGNGVSCKGILCPENDPKMHRNGYRMKINPNLKPGTHYNNNIKIYDIPCYILSPEMWRTVLSMERPDQIEMEKIASKNDSEIWLTMPLHAVQIEESIKPGTISKKERSLSASMNIFLFKICNSDIKVHTHALAMQGFLSADVNVFYNELCYDIFSSLRNIAGILSNNDYIVDTQAMNRFVENYSLYTELCRAAERWSRSIDHYIFTLVDSICRRTCCQPDDLWTGHSNSVFSTLSYIEKYNVPLEMYDRLYKKMQGVVPDNILTGICRANLNLKLANALEHMDKNKNMLPICPCTNSAQSAIPYSKEQMDAIRSTSPLVIVQSGAGTGKSTVILGRIDHMLANGVNPADIMVLSFTNIAADHISDMKPGVNSMTIASMMHTIYSHNFPKHQLSKLATIINSISIFFDNSRHQMPPDQEKFISDFKYVLLRLQNNNEFTKANNFVEENIDQVISVLDTIEQTSLELESIICYQCMDRLVEPQETKTKYLIIDEVQDNSIAEFIYSIKYTEQHQCSMYIVGDCSQTLYEFRSSNPKALNVLENSGVFDTYKLETNYRSNQEILDFANVQLENIEANRYANIRLRANSLTPVTVKSFQDAITLKYVRMINKSKESFENLISHAISVDTRDYVQDKLAKKEQVCILAPARKTLYMVKTCLEQVYPGKVIASLIPKRQYDNTLFSSFITNCWNNIAYIPPTNIMQTIRRELIANIASLVYRGSDMQQMTDMANRMLDEFESYYGKRIINWQNQVMASVMTQHSMLDEIKKLMLKFEIQKNNMAQAVTAAKNAETKQNNNITKADFIISTIHSAKGMEFDNVIILYASESETTIDEATKRMYYVALTRAKKTEYILAYDTLAKPKILGDYEMIIKGLSKNMAPAQMGIV